MSIRQEKFAGLIQEYLAEIFRLESASFNNEFITISKVEISPDLGYAKIYVSFISPKNIKLVMDLIELNSKKIRRELAKKIRKQARIVPELKFFVDDSLDYVFHMEQVLKNVKSEDEKKGNNN